MVPHIIIALVLVALMILTLALKLKTLKKINFKRMADDVLRIYMNGIIGMSLFVFMSEKGFIRPEHAFLNLTYNDFWMFVCFFGDVYLIFLYAFLWYKLFKVDESPYIMPEKKYIEL